MYRRGKYYRYYDRQSWGRRSWLLRLSWLSWSLRGSRKLMIIAVALFCGAGALGIANASSSGSWWWNSGAHVPVGHKKAKEKSAVSNTTTDSGTGSNIPAGIGGAVSQLGDLSQSDKKEIAMRLVSSAENSSLDWRSQFGYIEDIGDGRGYTAGIIGFCSGTGDMLTLVENYTKARPDNSLTAFLPALRTVNGTDSHAGLGGAFEKAWKIAATDSQFQQAQEAERDKVYFNPAVALAKKDGLSVLGQFMYYDAAVMHGPDAWGGGLPDLRGRAVAQTKTPAQGGDEKAYLAAFLRVRKAEMAKEAEHRDTSRIDDVQLAFLSAGNYSLSLPLNWKVYGDPFTITSL